MNLEIENKYIYSLFLSLVLWISSKRVGEEQLQLLTENNRQEAEEQLEDSMREVRELV